MNTRKFYCKKVVVVDRSSDEEVIRIFNDKEEVANWCRMSVGTIETYIKTRRTCTKLGRVRFYYLYEYTLLEEERAKAQYEEYFLKFMPKMKLEEL